MRTIKFLLFSFVIFSITSCSLSNNSITFQILQLNDVYEISPLEGGKVAGLARVATLKDSLLAHNPNLITVLAGDFLNPSFIGTLFDNEAQERIQGKQMVEVLNALGVDYVTFGNHEFDLKEDVLLSRMDLTDFIWTSANVFHKTDAAVSPFHYLKNGIQTEMPKFVTHTFKNNSGNEFRLGMISVTLPFNKADYVHYEDEVEVLKAFYPDLKKNNDAVVFMTHLEVKKDKEVAQMFPDVPLIMGGHDHDHMFIQMDNNVITKADANAKTVYLHTFTYNFSTKKLDLKSTLIPITNRLESQPKTLAAVEKWQKKAEESMNTMGFDPKEIVFNTKEILDGRESVIRNKPTLLGSLVAQSMLAAKPDADVSIVNGGSMRVDDQLIGVITAMDILRILPYGGKIMETVISGKDLLQILEIGTEKNVGIGGYTHVAGAVKDSNGNWLVHSKPIYPTKKYTLILPEFMAAGKEANFGFLRTFKSQVVQTEKTIQTENDSRHIFIAYLKKNPSSKITTD